MSRLMHGCVKLLAGLAAGLAIVLALAAWRLESGPVSLDFLRPYIEQGLADPTGQLIIGIEHALLTLDPQRHTLDLVARGVHLRSRAGNAELRLPELMLDLSLRAALGGSLAPTRVVVIGPSVVLDRATDGSFRLGLGAADQAAEGVTAQVLSALAAPLDRRPPLGYLTELVFRDATFTVYDHALGVTWRAKRTNATLFRGASGTYGDAQLTVEAGGRDAEIHGDFRYLPAEARLAVDLGFNGLEPLRFAGAAPMLAPLATLGMPLSGRIGLSLDTASLRIEGAVCEITLGAGSLRHPALVGGSLPIAGGSLQATYDPLGGRVTLQRFALDLGGPRVAVTGTIDGLGGMLLTGGMPDHLDIAAQATASEVPADDLPRLWPEHLAVLARNWVLPHIHDGVATEAHADARLRVDLAGDEGPKAHVESLAGTLAYRNLTVEYIPHLPPARQVDGTAVFDRTHFDLTPTSGVLKGLRATGGSVHLYKLDTNDEQASIQLTARGPLRDALEVIDSKPLGYVHALGLDPANVVGSAEAQLSFAFPLIHWLTIDQVDFGVRASLADVGVARMMFGQDIAGGDFDLRLDRAALRLEGKARFAGVPASLSWTQSLKPGDAVRSRYTLKARLDDAARQRLGLDLLPDVLSGPVDVDLNYALMARKQASASLALDLRDATLRLAQLGWMKPPGTPASAALQIDLAQDRVKAVHDVAIKGGGLDARLAAAFGADGGIDRVTIDRLVAGQTDVSGMVKRRGEGGWRVELRGRSLDATALLADLGKGKASDNVPEKPVDAPTPAEPPLVIDTRLDRLILGPKREAAPFTGQFYSDGVHWQTATVDAVMRGGGRLALRFGRAAGDHQFQLSTDDFGALLRLFDISDQVAGGQLTVTGRAEDIGRNRRFHGRAEGQAYRLVGAPLVARVLSIASFSGIAALLNGEGIPFSDLQASFVYDSDRVRLDVRELRASGGAIGVNAGGTVDFHRQTLDVAGTMVPAYTLNSLLGNIPVLGSLLMGGEGEGLFGANFHVAGPIAEPLVSVNPLSALAPGALRKLFGAGDPTQAPVQRDDGGSH